MTFFEKLTIIKRIDQLIRLKGTGSPKDFANRLNISRSTLYNIIDCMREMGAEIEYCRTRQSFFYIVEKKFSIGFVETQNIRGGSNFLSSVLLDNKWKF